MKGGFNNGATKEILAAQTSTSSAKQLSIVDCGPSKTLVAGAGTLTALAGAVAVEAYPKIVEVTSLIASLDGRLILLTIGTIGVYSLVSAVPHLMSRSRPSSSAHRNVESQTELLKTFILETSGEFEKIERDGRRNFQSLTPRGYAAINTARRILKALEARQAEISRLIANGTRNDLKSAARLLTTDLIIAENCYETLIDGDPIAPVKATDWFSTITTLLAEVHEEQAKARGSYFKFDNAAAA